MLEANPTKHTEKLVGAASEPPTAPQAASEDAPGIEGERTGYVAAISKHDDPIEVDSEAPVRNFGLREPKGKR